MASKGGIFTIKAQLQGVTKPPVWRRIRINGSSTFEDLHYALQRAFGWDGYHLHQFQPKRGPFGITFVIGPEDEDADYLGLETIDECTATLDRYLPYFPKQLEYIYDFGDHWVHSLTVESWDKGELVDEVEFLERRGAPPAEDCGGVYAFMHYRDLIVEAKTKGVDLRTVNYEDPESDLEYAVASLGTNFDPKNADHRPDWEYPEIEKE